MELQEEQKGLDSAIINKIVYSYSGYKHIIKRELIKSFLVKLFYEVHFHSFKLSK
jgi:hypothetical protein